MNKNKEIIESSYESIADINSENKTSCLTEAVSEVISLLNLGKLRVCEHTSDGWMINQWLKKAILLYFRINHNQKISTNISNYYDKIPLKFHDTDETQFNTLNSRIVPGSIVRYGAYIGNNVILMPSFVNIGAYVDDGTMIDTWATVGSCAYIGKNVHISGGTGIGGVLEPLQAQPTIIEDNCFIGARAEIVEGVIVERNSVISMGVFIGKSTKIFDRRTQQIYTGRVPAGSVVVPGSLPSKCGTYNLNCAVIIKTVDEQTRAKTSINNILREAQLNLEGIVQPAV